MRKISSRMIVKKATYTEAIMHIGNAKNLDELTALFREGGLIAKMTDGTGKYVDDIWREAVKKSEEFGKGGEEVINRLRQSTPIVTTTPVGGGVINEVIKEPVIQSIVTPEVAKAGEKQKFSEIFGKAKSYVSSLSPETKSRALKGILIGAGVVAASGLTYAAWSNISAGDGADALTAETSRIKEIIMPIFDNDTSPWTIGGDLTTDITDSDKNRFIRNITDAVLSNNTSQLSPEAISSLLVNLPSAKGDGMLGGNITYDSIMKADQSYATGDGGKTKGSIIDASEQLITIAGEIEKNAAAAEAAAATPTPVAPAPVAPTPAPTEPPPISARPAEAGGTTTPISSGIPEMSSILVDLGYLKTPQTSWTTELDTAFRAFMDKGTSLTKDMYHTNLASGKESWPEVASLVGFQPNIAGAAKAVKTLSDSLGPSVAFSGATSSDTAAAGGTDTLPSIVSAMYTGNLTKLLGPDFTRGIDLVNEERRMRILVGALGGASKEGYDNASKVILQQDPGLSADLPKIINGAITKDYVKQNMDLFKRIQTALNRITSGAFGPLAPANMNNAISKMKSWLQTKEGGGWTIQSVTSSQNSQWVKLANERKMKLRLQIAAEMTPAERAAARRIKMKEAVAQESYSFTKTAQDATEFAAAIKVYLRAGGSGSVNPKVYDNIAYGIKEKPAEIIKALKGFSASDIKLLLSKFPGLKNILSAGTTALTAGGAATTEAAASTALTATTGAGASTALTATTGAGGALATGPGTALATVPSTALATVPQATGGTAAAAGGGIGAGTLAIGASVLALLSYPKLAQKYFGGVDEKLLQSAGPVEADNIARDALNKLVQGYWEKIIDCDVAEGEYGGDLADIADYENSAIIKEYANAIFVATKNPKMRDYPLSVITYDSIIDKIAKAEDISGGSWAARFIAGSKEKRSVDNIKNSPCVKSGSDAFLAWVAGYVADLKKADVVLPKTPIPTPTPKPSGGGSGGGGGSYSKTPLIAPKGEILKEVGTDGKEYEYTVISPMSFSYTTNDMPTPKTVSAAGNSRWNDAAKVLNDLYAKKQQNVPETAATPTATPATPAATAEAAETGLDQGLIQKVAAILQKAILYPLNIRSLQNEQSQIRSLSGKLKGLTGLAAVIVSRVGGVLTTISGTTPEEINSSTQKDLAVNRGGKFSDDVGTIFRQINELFKIGNKNPESLDQLSKNITISQKAATAANTSLDKKFIKAATLRRMRIRSQMEAAVDSSAQMGRSRVF